MATTPIPIPQMPQAAQPMSESLGMPSYYGAGLGMQQPGTGNLGGLFTMGPGGTPTPPQQFQMPEPGPTSARTFGPGEGAARKRESMQNMISSGQKVANMFVQAAQQKQQREYQSVLGPYTAAVKALQQAPALVQQGKAMQWQAAQTLANPAATPEQKQQAQQQQEQGAALVSQGQLSQLNATTQLKEMAADTKKNRIISRAWGVDSSNRISPERQALEQMYQKQYNVDQGAAHLMAEQPMTMQPSAQFEQQQAAVGAGVVGKAVTGDAALRAQASQMGAPKITTLSGYNGQTLKEPVQAIEQGGKFFVNGQEVQNPIAYEKPATGPMALYDEWKKDPKSVDAFQKMVADGKKSSGFGTGYAAIHFLQMGYNENPALLPIAAPMVANFLRNQGIPVTDQQVQDMAKTPLGQPLSSVTGAPIGLRMPGAPTGATRTTSQNAARVVTEMPGIRLEINDEAENLGPAKGRLMMGFLLGTVGSTGDPVQDRKLAEMRSDLTGFIGSAAAKFHINSVQAMKIFDQNIAAGKSSADAIQGTLDSIEKWAKTAQAQGLGYGEKTTPASGDTSIPSGATMQVPGSDGSMHWSDGKNDLGVVQ